MSGDTDLGYSEVEEELRANVRALLADRAPAQATLARTETEQTTDLALWRALAGELGVTGLPVPEELGGAGASWREVAVVLEELGRAVAPVPYFGSCVLATAALLTIGERKILPQLASGEAIGTLAVPFAKPPAGAFPTDVRVSGGLLSGTVRHVADALAADVLLVPAVAEDGTPELYAVTGAYVEPMVSLDMTRQLAVVTLEEVEGVLLASGSNAAAAVGAALEWGAALLASEQLGVAEWALTTTVAYAKERHQFGRPIGSFQAVKHRLADLWVLVTQLRAVARAGAGAVTRGVDVPLCSALAQAFASGAAVTAAEEAVQLHGGIGFTWEHPAHLYLKRAKSASLALGTADRHRARIAELVDLEV
ncbi:acyl-CoA dehydrogenase [Streptacidiphilus pinicola]|uniref:Acyl-CoA dehydrogenase n=1 Tax=Streptacidiphilus pinicola TaxID=2219663 RepID=A0A2X0KIS3_9ACTN|nr:acyl-CoA dehydrogenase family protein [Streptacidiphilus pinicola]RAG86640.1 acyl-CoA dehydrogenase [Streptacidiphilus pinicola]